MTSHDRESELHLSQDKWHQVHHRRIEEQETFWTHLPRGNNQLSPVWIAREYGIPCSWHWRSLNGSKIPSFASRSVPTRNTPKTLLSTFAKVVGQVYGWVRQHWTSRQEQQDLFLENQPQRLQGHTVWLHLESKSGILLFTAHSVVSIRKKILTTTTRERERHKNRRRVNLSEDGRQDGKQVYKADRTPLAEWLSAYLSHGFPVDDI